VNNAYEDPVLQENPPAIVNIAKVVRHILADKPRITKFPIDWTGTAAVSATETKDMYTQERIEMMKNAPTPPK